MNAQFTVLLMMKMINHYVHKDYSYEHAPNAGEVCPMRCHKEHELEKSSCFQGALTIKVSRIVENWLYLCDIARPAEVAAVVKANAYGLGMTEVARGLLEGGCRIFFVATLDEGIKLRGLSTEIVVYVLNGLSQGFGDLYLNHELQPVLGSVEEVNEWRTLCARRLVRGKMALHVDTGMNRHGIEPASFVAHIKSWISAVEMECSLVMSHFISAENEAAASNSRQLELFRDLRSYCPHIPASLSNSSGVFLGRSAHHDIVRAGYALYGGNPTLSRTNPMKEVVKLEVPIQQIRQISAGETVGYESDWTAPHPVTLALITAGYADGYPRSASASNDTRHAKTPIGTAIIAGEECSFAGRVSMDLIVVDVTPIAERDLRRGDMATLIGDGLTFEDVAARANTIGREILIRLGARYNRIYEY